MKTYHTKNVLLRSHIICALLLVPFCVAFDGCGGASNGGSALVAPLATATPITGMTPPPGLPSQPPPTVGPASLGSPVPAPTGADLTNLLSGTPAVASYLTALAATIPTPAPPAGPLAIAGTVQTLSGGTLVISTSGGSNTPHAYFLGANVGLGPLTSVTLTNRTVIDSPRGIGDLSPGTLVVAGGTLSAPNTLAASFVTPITSASIARGRARRLQGFGPVEYTNSGRDRRSISLAAGQRGASARAPLGTQDSAGLTFSQNGIGLGGVSFQLPVTFNVNSCTTISWSVVISLGIGTTYTWPVTVRATETAPITVGTVGAVDFLAQGTALSPPAQPNIHSEDGIIVQSGGSVRFACGPFPVTLNTPSIGFGYAVALDYSGPAQFGDTALVLCSSTLTDALGCTSNAPGALDTSCADITPVPGWFDVLIHLPSLQGSLDLQLCPRLTISSGALSIGSVGGVGADIITNPPYVIAPQFRALVKPTDARSLSYQIQVPNGRNFYQFQVDGALDAQLVTLNQAIYSHTFGAAPQLYMPSSDAALSWKLDAAPPAQASGPAFPSGELYLSINDNVFGDNSGQWNVSVAGLSGGPKQLQLPGNVQWMDSGIGLSAGERVTVSASGLIYIGNVSAGQPGISNYQTPAGDPNTTTAAQQGRGPPFAAPGLVPWSLVGKVGTTGTPFEIGNETTIGISSTIRHPR